MEGTTRVLGTNIKCPCGKDVYVQPSRVGRKKYCSKKCLYENMPRPSGLVYNVKVKNRAWFKRNPNKKTDDKGYLRVHVGRNVYKRVHRYVMELQLGRELSVDEIVHHKNGNKVDNRIENLVIMSKREHDLLHNGKKICVS